MRILAFAASNSSKSINRTLVEYAASLAEGHEIETLDIHDFEMPIFSEDREREMGGVPQLAHDFLARIAAVDAIIISYAEHNGAYPAAYKNLFDWCSRLGGNIWQDKKMALLATSDGGRGAQTVLGFAVDSTPRFGGEVVGHLSVPHYSDVFDKEAGKLTDAELDKALRALVAELTA